MTDADVYDCGNKLDFLSANLAIGMREITLKTSIYELLKNYSMKASDVD